MENLTNMKLPSQYTRVLKISDPVNMVIRIRDSGEWTTECETMRMYPLSFRTRHEF